MTWNNLFAPTLILSLIRFILPLTVFVDVDIEIESAINLTNALAVPLNVCIDMFSDINLVNALSFT